MLMDPTRPLTQDEVRGLFVHSVGTTAGMLSFPKEQTNIARILAGNGAYIDVNIACGLQRFIQICAEYGISLQPEACKPVPPLNLEAPRSVAEAIHMQEENEEKGQGIVEAPIAPEIVETKQKLVRAKKAKATKKPTQ